MKKLSISLSMVLVVGLLITNNCFAEGSLHSTIKQIIRQQSYIKNTFVVRTVLYIYNGTIPQTIESSLHDFDVPHNKVKIITLTQYNKTLKIKQEVDKWIKENSIAR